VIEVGKKGERESLRFQFQVVLEVLKGDREVVETARTGIQHPSDNRVPWKQEFLENGVDR
jgi:hypothetical protein